MLDLAIVGAGPRGISVIERIAALNPTTECTLHIIDDAQLGAGRIWDTEQTRTLCMNTLAGAVTLFCEQGSSVSAPVLEGPTQYEWIRLIRGEREGIAPAKVELFESYPIELPEFAEEFARTEIHSNPSRASYGAYLHWVYSIALDRLPNTVTVREHNQRAISIDDAGDHDIITLTDGTTVRADATVLATGWTVPGLNEEEERLANTGLNWIRPDNPVEQDLSSVKAAAPVIIRGLGMGFFDTMALLTIGRGGHFDEEGYHRSGKEPIIYVASGRGYPYLPKSDYGGLPPKAQLPRLKKVMRKLSDAESFNYDTDVWPAVVRDAYEAYYRAAGAGDLSELIDNTDLDQLSETLAPYAKIPFRLEDWVTPLKEEFSSIEDLTQHIIARLESDIAEAKAGLDSPLKAALWSISASRKPSQILGAEGKMTWQSRANTYSTMMAVGQMAGSGPPLFRTQQLLALAKAGIVRFLGARPEISVVDGAWRAYSANSQEEVQAEVLIDAWMHSPDITRPKDPLWASLGERIRAFGPTGSPEVEPRSRRVINADGSVDPRVHVIGIPTYGQLPDTTISPMPGTDPLMLRETDATAVDLLRY